MSYLLVPEDEKDLVTYLVNGLGLRLLLSDVAPNREPRVAQDPWSAVPTELGKQNDTTPSHLIFWCSQLGPIRTLVDAPVTSDARTQVARQLTQQMAGHEYEDIIDLSRTPVIRWLRCSWHAPNRLKPALLQGMELEVRQTPKPVLKLYAKVGRWLKSRGEKLNPFEHCMELPGAQPRNLKTFWVWVHRHALESVKRGLEIWPWTG